MFKSSAGIGQHALPLGSKPRIQIPKPACIREVVVQSDMAWATLTLASGSVLVGYHANKPPSKESWNGWLSTKKREIIETRLARVVVFTEGGAPSKEQQAQLKSSIYPEWSERGILARVGIQIVTSNPIFGSLVSATVAVLRVSARALGFDRIIEFYGNAEGALDFATIPPREWDTVKDVRDYLSQELRAR
jgi:hypothetical protein